MALSIVKKKEFVIGDRKAVLADVTFDNSYPTGGEPLAKKDLFFDVEVDHVDASPAGGFTFHWDDANAKLLAYQGDNTNAAAAPSVQVANATDLHTVTTRVFAIGK